MQLNLREKFPGWIFSNFYPPQPVVVVVDRILSNDVRDNELN